MEQVTVIFVSYNSAAVLPGALASVPPGCRVIVHDNGSADGSADLAEAAGATVIRCPDNLGFGTACNRAAERAETAFLLFLNPDARLEPDTIAALLDDAETHPEAAAFGPVLVEPDGTVPLPRAATLLEPDAVALMHKLPDRPVETGFLSGAALLIRRAAFRAAGGFDEALFLYVEDDDLCLRLRRAGQTLRLVPGARVVHDEASSSKPSVAGLRFRNHHTMRSQVIAAAKHGVALDAAAFRRQAWQRILRSVLLLDLTRVRINLGRLSGLRAGERAVARIARG